MIERTIAKRYARALLEVAVAAKAVQRVEEEILAVGREYREQPGMAALFENPVITRAEKKQALRALFEGKVSKEVLEFLDLLVDRRRCDLIPAIEELFDDLADEYEGVVRATVTSAQPLGDAEAKRLHDKLAALMGGKDVDMRLETDPSLLGGMQIRVRDTVFDASVSGKLKRLHEGLLFAQRTTT